MIYLFIIVLFFILFDLLNCPGIRVVEYADKQNNGHMSRWSHIVRQYTQFMYYMFLVTEMINL